MDHLGRLLYDLTELKQQGKDIYIQIQKFTLNKIPALPTMPFVAVRGDLYAIRLKLPVL